MLGGKGRSLVIMGAFLLTGGFGFKNWYLVISGLFFIFATFVSQPAFQSSMNVGELKVWRELDNTRVFQDDFMHVKVHIENTGGNRFDFLDIFDEFPTDVFRLVAGENYITTRIDPHKEIKFSYVLAPKVRGEFKLGPIDLVVRDRLGFNAEHLVVPHSITDIVIYPPYAEIKKLELMGAKRAVNMSFGIHRTKIIGSGTDFHALREYVSGDQYRLIDWRASMRMQKLIVREFESERNISTSIIIDASESMAGGAVDNTKFEMAVKSGMLLSKIAIDQGDRVSVCTFSDKKHFRFLEPSSKSTHFSDIITFLGGIMPTGSKQIFWSMQEYCKRYQKRSLVFLITDLEVATVDIVAALRKLKSFGHSIVIIAPFSPWFEIHELELSRVDKALAEAISEEMMLHVLDVKKSCKKLGVPVIPVAPDDMFDVIIREYEDAKRHGRAE